MARIVSSSRFFLFQIFQLRIYSPNMLIRFHSLCNDPFTVHRNGFCADMSCRHSVYSLILQRFARNSLFSAPLFPKRSLITLSADSRTLQSHLRRFFPVIWRLLPYPPVRLAIFMAWAAEIFLSWRFFPLRVDFTFTKYNMHMGVRLTGKFGLHWYVMPRYRHGFPNFHGKNPVSPRTALPWIAHWAGAIRISRYCVPAR